MLVLKEVVKCRIEPLLHTHSFPALKLMMQLETPVQTSYSNSAAHLGNISSSNLTNYGLQLASFRYQDVSPESAPER